MHDVGESQRHGLDLIMRHRDGCLPDSGVQLLDLDPQLASDQAWKEKLRGQAIVRQQSRSDVPGDAGRRRPGG